MSASECTCLFGPREVDGETVHHDDCAVAHPVRHASWQGVLAIVDDLPRETGGTKRSIGDFTEDDDGSSSMAATFSVGQPDGSHKVYEITVRIRESVDHSDAFWGPGGRRDGDDPSRRVVIGGEHYLLGDDKPGYPRGYKGFGGRRVDIEFHDGRRVTTTDLWHQGTVPPKWRERYPDNARFVTKVVAS